MPENSLNRAGVWDEVPVIEIDTSKTLSIIGIKKLLIYIQKV